MTKGVTSRFSRYGRVTTARLILLWIIFQSVFAAAMPMSASHECCSDDIQSVAHEHHHADIFHKEMMHEPTLQEGSLGGKTLSMDHRGHSQCEHCTFGCQAMGSDNITPTHTFDPLKHSDHQLFFVPSNSLDLPFRPPTV